MSEIKNTNTNTNTESAIDSILKILPESHTIAVDNNEKYASFSLVFAVVLTGTSVRLVDTNGFKLYSYQLQDSQESGIIYRELVKRLKMMFPQDNIHELPTMAFRMKFIYGVTIFEHGEKTILSFSGRKGYSVLSEEGKSGSLDSEFEKINEILCGEFPAKKFRLIHKHCLLSADAIANTSAGVTQRGVVVKVGEKLISFVAEDDPGEKARLLQSIVAALKS